MALSFCRTTNSSGFKENPISFGLHFTMQNVFQCGMLMNGKKGEMSLMMSRLAFKLCRYMRSMSVLFFAVYV